MRRKLIAGNWKLHGSRLLTTQWVAAAAAAASATAQVDVAVLPPATYLNLGCEQAANTPLWIGAQTCAAQDSGAYTGEVAAAMIADCGAKLVLVGHSERRQFFGETLQITVQKFRAAQLAGLLPVLCVGENLAQREAGDTQLTVASQLAVILDAFGASAFNHAAIAYEPVWAIGTGKTATAAQAQEVHAAIRSQIARLDAKVACSVRILYGGSVKASNASTLLTQIDVDGALVGGASLDPLEFAAIVAAAS
jgi:triosephosphate isomerase